MYGSGSYGHSAYASTISGILVTSKKAVDSATGEEVLFFRHKGLIQTDSGVGSQTSNLLALLTQSDSAIGIEFSQTYGFLDNVDKASGDSHATVLIPSTEGVQGYDLATGNEEDYRILLLGCADSGIGSDLVTGILDVTDLIIKLEGREDVQINLGGVHDINRLEGIEDIEVDLDSR